MTKKMISPYGSWASPITTDMITTNAVRIEEITCDRDDIYWLEFRASEAGRQVIVRYSPDGTISDVTPPDYNVRNRVHEYGGGSYHVFQGIVYFCNYRDQRIYKLVLEKEPVPITPENFGRYADLVLDEKRKRLICILEQHGSNEKDVRNSLAAVALDGNDPVEILVSGNDFYSNPRISPDGSQLCWLTWNHPNMPWDGCELWIGSIDRTGKIVRSRCIAGGRKESIFKPEWSPSGDLIFISDQSGWWIPYCFRDNRIIPLTDLQAEFGLPQWVFGLSTYGFYDPDQLVCVYSKSGNNHLAILNINNGIIRNLPTPYVEFSAICVSKRQIIFVGGSSDHPSELVRLNPDSGDQIILRQTGNMQFDKGFVSTMQRIEFPSQNNQVSHGNFYPPKNPNHNAPDEEKPPLIVVLHGGPTSSASPSFNIKIQYWTSRGFAVLDVNYSGSSGFGRAYRRRLDGNWGILDVEDCIQGAKFLASKGLIDGKRMSITGGSAGGYTTLCALAFHNAFSAGVSRYGIGSLETLAADTHKFEAHYLDSLVGPFPTALEVYRQRSPIYFIERINAPVLLLQGSEDKVVPPIQSERMYEELNAKGSPVAYVLFEGEQHGFRKAESIKRALEIELYFYSRIFKFHPAEILDPIEIKNLKMGD